MATGIYPPAVPELTQTSWSKNRGYLSSERAGLAQRDPITGQLTPETVQLYEQFFGAPLRELDQRAYARQPQDVTVLHDNWKGPNPFITDVIRQQIETNDSIWYHNILPLKQFNGQFVSYERLEFNEHTLVREPELGVAPTVTRQRLQKTWGIPRYGIQFMMENGFLMTPEGIREYFESIWQMECAIHNTLVPGILTVLLEAPETPSNWQQAYRLPYDDVSLDRMFEYEQEMFGILNKRENAIHYLAAHMEKMMRTRQKADAPDTLIIPNGLVTQYRLAHKEEASFMEKGERGPARFESEGGPMRAILGKYQIIESPLLFTGNEIPEDFCMRERTFGEHAILDTRDWSSYAPADYRSSNVSTSFMDWSSNKFMKVGLKHGLRYSGLFYPPNIKPVDGSSSSRRGQPGVHPFGFNAVFGQYTTFGEYLDKTGVESMFAKSFNSKDPEVQRELVKTVRQGYAPLPQPKPPKTTRGPGLEAEEIDDLVSRYAKKKPKRYSTEEFRRDLQTIGPNYEPCAKMEKVLTDLGEANLIPKEDEENEDGPTGGYFISPSVQEEVDRHVHLKTTSDETRKAYNSAPDYTYLGIRADGLPGYICAYATPNKLGKWKNFLRSIEDTLVELNASGGRGFHPEEVDFDPDLSEQKQQEAKQQDSSAGPSKTEKIVNSIILSLGFVRKENIKDYEAGLGDREWEVNTETEQTLRSIRSRISRAAEQQSNDLTPLGILYSTPCQSLTYNFFNALIDADVFFPIGFIFERLHCTWRTGSFICMKAGEATGSTYLGFEDIQLSTSAMRKHLIGHLTVNFRPIVMKPENVLIMPNVYIEDYISGGGHTFYDACDANEVLNYQRGNRTKDIHVMACPLNQMPTRSIIDVTGRFPATMMTPNANTPLHYGSAQVYSSLWRWETQNQYFDSMNPYDSQIVLNTRSSQMTQYFPRQNGTSIPDELGEKITGTLHPLGHIVYPGVRTDLCGRGRGMVNCAYQDQARERPLFMNFETGLMV